MGAPALLLLLLGGLWVQPAGAGSHALRYFRSALSERVPPFPLFSTVGFVDDAEITRYTSETRRMEPRAPWMQKISAQDPGYWDRETKKNQDHENVHLKNVKIMMGRVNHRGGLHIVQLMFGCVLGEDGTADGYIQYAYDGQDLITFDKDRMIFRALSDTAGILVDTWNLDRELAQSYKDYLEVTCITDLQKHLKNGEESLQRVRPEKMVYQKKDDVGTTLTCHAYGFYPREIDIKWVRNGVEMPWRSKQILPHPDGTYQAKTTVEVHEGDDVRNYNCQVEHSSLEEIVTVVYEDKSSPTQNIGLLAGMIVGVLMLLAAVIGGFVIWKKKRSVNADYVPPGTGPDPCDSCPV